MMRFGCHLDGVQPEIWRNTHYQHQYGQRPKHQLFAKPQVRCACERHLAFRAVEESLYHPQHVRGAEDHTQRRNNGPALAYTSKRARQDQEFTDKSIQERQANHGEGHDHKEGCKPRSPLRQAAIGCDLRCCITKFESTKQDEQSCIDQFIVEDLIGRAGPAGEGESVDAKRDQAEVTERSKCKESPEVALYKGKARTVEDTDDRQRDHQGRDGF